MSHLQVIARLEDMLRMALDIVNQQAQLLEQHGIETLEAADPEDPPVCPEGANFAINSEGLNRKPTGQLEAAERKLREDMEGWC